MRKKLTLFVEGDDDLHVIKTICGFYKIPQTFKVKVPENKDIIPTNEASEKKGGIDNVFKAMEFSLIEGSEFNETVGIVVDADDNLNSRWQKVVGILEKAGYDKENIPNSPDKKGTKIEQEFLPAFGVWIMPDNIITRGMLEDFLEFLVPNKDENEVWQKAIECTKEVLEIEEETFSEIHLSKAQMHAYLAWQKECGKPFGQAITSKYLRVDNPRCQIFVDWLNRLFVD